MPIPRTPPIELAANEREPQPIGLLRLPQPRFTAQAGDVLQLVADGPPAHRGPAIIGDDYVMPANWKGNVIFHQDKIAACSPDQVLTIDAWDLS